MESVVDALVRGAKRSDLEDGRKHVDEAVNAAPLLAL
jgi:hypothetical protein